MWICPTFQRPDRLQSLAESWEKFEKGKTLKVRVYKEDPYKEIYFKRSWPEGWELYESASRGAGEALNECFDEEDCYGFIADDIVLKTPQGLEILEETSKPWFVAYPNDTLQRHNLPTHFCVGYRLAKAMGGVVPPMFKHSYMDVGLLNISSPFHLLRYCPQVIFQHNHFFNGSPKDNTYSLIYPKGTTPSGEYEIEGQKALKEFKSYFEKTSKKIYTELREYECT